MEKAIRKSIEGGYKKPNWITGLNWAIIFTDDTSERKMSDIYRILLDPLFWQALERAEGWEGTMYPSGTEWQIQWHKFIDHFAEGKDAESFFTSLLK